MRGTRPKISWAKYRSITKHVPRFWVESEEDVKLIPVIRWNTKTCDEPDHCLRLDDFENAKIFWKAINENEVYEGEVNKGLWIRCESVTEAQWKEIESNTE